MLKLWWGAQEGDLLSLAWHVRPPPFLTAHSTGVVCIFTLVLTCETFANSLADQVHSMWGITEPFVLGDEMTESGGLVRLPTSRSLKPTCFMGTSWIVGSDEGHKLCPLSLPTIQDVPMKRVGFLEVEHVQDFQFWRVALWRTHYNGCHIQVFFPLLWALIPNLSVICDMCRTIVPFDPSAFSVTDHLPLPLSARMQNNKTFHILANRVFTTPFKW